MKKILFVLMISFLIQSYSYAKFIELEKCYSTKNILNSNETDIEKPEDLKWSEDYYKIRYTSLYHIYDPKDSSKIIKIDDREKKLGENLNFHKNYGMVAIGPKEIKNILKQIKQYEKQGFQKVFPTHEFFFSINTNNGIITRTQIYTADEMVSLDHQESWYEANNKKQGRPHYPWNITKITNWKYRIDNYSGGIIQATEVGSDNRQKIAINLKNNLIIFSTDMSIGAQRTYISNTYAICKSAGSKSSNSYTKYWWAVVLIAAVIFFIYTQTNSEIGDSNKKQKSNLLKSFFVFLKKIVHKNKIIAKEKKIEHKKPLKSKSLLIKFLKGKESLAYSFWFMYTALTTLNEIIRYILRANDLLFAAGLYFVFQWCYFIFATIGTWKSATNYKINKQSKNEGAGWAMAVYIYLVISLATSLLRTIKSLG